MEDYEEEPNIIMVCQIDDQPIMLSPRHSTTRERASMFRTARRYSSIKDQRKHKNEEAGKCGIYEIRHQVLRHEIGK